MISRFLLLRELSILEKLKLLRDFCSDSHLFQGLSKLEKKFSGLKFQDFQSSVNFQHL